MSPHRHALLSLVMLAAALPALPDSASAEPLTIQGPALTHTSPQRARRIKAMRRQRIAPQTRNGQPRNGQRSWASPETLRRLSAMNPRSAEYRQAISSEPLQARLQLFMQKAEAAGQEVQRFDRRLRGMVQMGKKRTGPETLLQVVATGGMGNKAAELIRDGKVKVYDKAARLEGHALTNALQKVSPRAKVWVEKGNKKYGVKRARVSSPKKTFFQVTPETFPLFMESFGNNVAWFTVNKKPTHLYTVIGDQQDGQEAHMVEYGVKAKRAGVTSHNTQYSMPVVLTDGEMDRLVRYMKAGSGPESETRGEKVRAFGFFAGRKKISNIACTNWVSSAPIGRLKRWVRQLDKRLIALSASGEIRVPELVAQKGLHAALASAADGRARAEIVDQVLQNRLPKYIRRSARKLLRRFKEELEGNLPSSEELGALIDPLIATLPTFDDRSLPYPPRSAAKTAKNSLVALKNVFAEVEGPKGKITDKLNQAVKNLDKIETAFKEVSVQGSKQLRQDAIKLAKKLAHYYTGMDQRPADLVARTSFAETLGLKRSQDPAKWSYDLLLSKRVPVVAVFNPKELPANNVNYQAFGPNLEFVMEIMGTVGADGRVKHGSFSDSHPNSGAVGELPSDPAAFGLQHP